MPKTAVRSFWNSDLNGPVLLAAGVGLLGGAGAIVFRYLIETVDDFCLPAPGRAEGMRGILSFLGDAYVIVMPAIGLFVVSWIVRRWAPEAQGHGVPEVMYAIRKEGGRIRPRVAGIKALVSALCIGTGGSVGREGPIVQIGCTVGSSIGQALKLNEQRVRLLVACGAGAGIAGTFNAPIAGVIFAMEVILGSFAARSFGLVVVSSVTATALCRAVLGSEQAFLLAEIFSLRSPAELPLYVVFGLLAGLVAVSTVQILYNLEDLFHRWRWPAGMKAIVAGLIVGGIGYVGIRYLGGPHLLGVGYTGIEEALHLGKDPDLTWGLGGMTFTALLLLTVLKIPAMSVTLAGGGSGGVFAPSIFIGAMLGGAFGMAVNALLPGITAPAGAYALVGMGAVFAGAAHAPITAILILFEMTDDYQIILPLMIAVVISHLVSSRLNPDSVYTIKLRRRGGLTPPVPEASVLEQILVTDAMTTDFHTVSPTEPIQKLAAQIHRSHLRAFEVVDEEGRLVGIVTEFDVESALMAGDVATRRVEEIMTRDLVTCTPGQSMGTVLQMFSQRDFGQIPVVAEEDPGKLLGVLRRTEILWAYSQLAGEHRRMLLDSLQALPTDHGDTVHVRLEVQPGNDRLCDRRVRDIRVPDQSLIAVLHRGERAIVPRGDTVVEPGDVLVLLTVRAREPRLRRWVESIS